MSIHYATMTTAATRVLMFSPESWANRREAEMRALGFGLRLRTPEEEMEDLRFEESAMRSRARRRR